MYTTSNPKKSSNHFLWTFSEIVTQIPEIEKEVNGDV